MPNHKSHTVRVASSAVLLAALLASCGRPDLPDTDSESYRELVGAFYTGIAALHVGDNERAIDRLIAATELAPGEPTTWANLAIARLRVNDVTGAAAALAKARSLAPTDARLATLNGELASRSGAVDDAIESYREAIELDPGALRARYALKDELERAQTGDTPTQVVEQLHAILEREPTNIVAQLDLALVSARQNDSQALQDALDSLGDNSADWPADALEQLDLAMDMAAEDQGSASVQAVAILGNLLRPTLEYQQDLALLASTTAEIGLPIEQFVELPSPSARPDPADTELTFTEGQLSTATGRGLCSSPPMVRPRLSSPAMDSLCCLMGPLTNCPARLARKVCSSRT
jgi:Flp pilus assembly protein TadD